MLNIDYTHYQLPLDLPATIIQNGLYKTDILSISNLTVAPTTNSLTTTTSNRSTTIKNYLVIDK